MQSNFDPLETQDESYLDAITRHGEPGRALSQDALDQPVVDLELRDAVTVPPTTTLRAAVQLMREQRFGCLLVESADRLVGIFTERDALMQVVLEDLDLDRVTVSEVMTAEPETLGPDDAMSYAINLMAVGGYRHVPVIDDDGKPIHVVSLRDIARYIAACFPESVHNLPPVPGQYAPRRHGG